MEGVGGIVNGSQTNAGEPLYEEGRRLYTEETVVVKRGIGPTAARMIPPLRCRELIEDGARRALGDLKTVEPYRPPPPVEIKVEYKGTREPTRLAGRPGIELLDPRTVVSRADDWWAAWSQFYF